MSEYLCSGGKPMKYACTVCGYIYDDAREKVPFQDLPDTWTCPLCGARKSDFAPVEEQAEKQNNKQKEQQTAVLSSDDGNIVTLHQLTKGQLAAVCTNLARGCEKQYLTEEASLYRQLGEYFSENADVVKDASVEKCLEQLEGNITEDYPEAKKVAENVSDRGALRAITWGEKVTRMLNSLLKRYNAGEAVLNEHDEVWVCTACGFVYIGETPPELCPVCKVPSWKFEKIEGEHL